MRVVFALTCILLLIGSLESVTKEEGSCSAVGSLGTTAECTDSSSNISLEANNDQEKTSLTRQGTSLVSSDDPDCIDQDQYCKIRALQGHCAKRPAQMLHQCPHSCALCNNHLKEERQVRTCYGEVQNARESKTLQHIHEMQEYMIRTVYVDDETYGQVRAEVRAPSADWIVFFVHFSVS